MLAPSGDLLRTGLGIKINQVKRATRSYIRDRASQATENITSHIVAIGLFATAGIFLIAACLVGITALFDFVEINYGLFPAFGVVGALLIVIAMILAGLASARLRRKPRQFPSLSSRLRVAVKASPLKADDADADADTAAAILTASSVPPRTQRGMQIRRERRGGALSIGLVAAAALAGVALARRRPARTPPRKTNTAG
ncbi:MAG: phage holin family protein [Bradyrhizobium sp.]|uniref:phage holin family protein n=1 Tax=Bradyrhizobium sp. TaxID=376 RepID=UPI001D45A13C|nr:phage holin family protein [Bradyrhizobium sp.]MBV9564775.1 phage holin family protein [Bradyrhizobium sp.]